MTIALNKDEEKMKLNLYRVKLQGMWSDYGHSYVVAENSDIAYRMVRKFLDEKNLGFSKDRGLKEVELVAGEYQYNDTRRMLYLPKKETEETQNNAKLQHCEIADDIECAKDWLRPGRPITDNDIDKCVKELDNLIWQLRKC